MSSHFESELRDWNSFNIYLIIISYFIFRWDEITQLMFPVNTWEVSSKLFMCVWGYTKHNIKKSTNNNLNPTRTVCLCYVFVVGFVYIYIYIYIFFLGGGVGKGLAYVQKFAQYWCVFRLTFFFLSFKIVVGLWRQSRERSRHQTGQSRTAPT